MMNKTLFHDGTELFERFRLNEESEITYTDSCKELLYPHRKAMKFTSRALLILHPPVEHRDWAEAETIGFIPWQNVHSLENLSGNRTTKRITAEAIKTWVSSLTDQSIQYPYLHTAPRNVALVIPGVPRSERSKGGKRRMRLAAEATKAEIQKTSLGLFREPVEMKIDIFSTDLARLPDVDRLCKAIMDAFEGIVYVSDKQVVDLRPRVIDSAQAYSRLECTTQPMPFCEVNDIAAGSLYPLATGVLDYYVIRISVGG